MKKRSEIRYNPKKFLAVLNQDTNEIIGNLSNLSKSGAMILTVEPVLVSTKFRCKIKLLKPIMEHEEIIFGAVCCWCRKNVASNLWESGYQLEVSGIDKELLSYLTLIFVLDHLKFPNQSEYKTIQLENRRYNTRYEPKVFFPVLEKLSSSQLGEIVDLSNGGIKMLTSLYHKKGSIVEYRVKLPKRIFQKDYLMFKAECRWLKKCELTGKFEIGLKFVSLSQQDSVIILYLIIHHLEECSSTQRVRVVQ